MNNDREFLAALREPSQALPDLASEPLIASAHRLDRRRRASISLCAGGAAAAIGLTVTVAHPDRGRIVGIRPADAPSPATSPYDWTTNSVSFDAEKLVASSGALVPEGSIVRAVTMTCVAGTDHHNCSADGTRGLDGMNGQVLTATTPLFTEEAACIQPAGNVEADPHCNQGFIVFSVQRAPSPAP